MKNPSKYLILTNNPTVVHCIPDRYEISYQNVSYRDILVAARDLIFAGHRIYTHPLSGSVKPNETPYKSIVLSKHAGKMEMDDSILISNCIEAFDKFKPCSRVWADQVYKDFQVIDYALLCGALELDAVTGLSNYDNHLEGGVLFEIGAGLYPD